MKDMDHVFNGDDVSSRASILNRSLIPIMESFLQRIASYHTLMALEMEGSPAGKSYLEASQDSIQRSLALLDEFARLSTHSMIEKESFDLWIFLESVIGRINKIPSSNVRCHLITEDDRIKCDQIIIPGCLSLLQQTFMNLPYFWDDITKNKSSAENIELYISLSPIKIESHNLIGRKTTLLTGDYVCINISISQNTLALEELVTLNEQLIQNDKSCWTANIIYTYGIIKEHNGEILINKSKTTPPIFTILLPMLGQDANMVSIRNLSYDDVKGTETILVVDDEDIIWDVVIDMLQNLGYTVILAANGRECVEIYHNNPGQINLVLLDMVMPEMNGRECFFALRVIDPGTKVLLSSGYVDEKDARDVLQAGAGGFLKKPYRMIDLAKKIRQILDVENP